MHQLSQQHTGAYSGSKLALYGKTDDMAATASKTKSSVRSKRQAADDSTQPHWREPYAELSARVSQLEQSASWKPAAAHFKMYNACMNNAINEQEKGIYYVYGQISLQGKHNLSDDIVNTVENKYVKVQIVVVPPEESDGRDIANDGAEKLFSSTLTQYEL
ncbi:hypothetical protein EB796_021207 [Bugula neritina]|uniref:Uncharacterized protein n=1 Tax=Bugula neritina TaxID=10212 RepID=A0A7J7J2Q9_BUGNE|nr:hypothetical protein EB796_021207 [Bugula neritina]